MSLGEYQRKRDFGRTPEPEGTLAQRPPEGPPRFVVQEHQASRHHFDFRLEVDGVLKSWAVPKGPSTALRDPRLAVQVEDHPLEYLEFEGHIPQGSYGAGTVIVWDLGTYRAKDEVLQGLEKGKLSFELAGRKLRGWFALVRTQDRQWLLIKEKDEQVGRPIEDPRSVLSGLTLEEMGQAEGAQVWVAELEDLLRELDPPAWRGDPAEQEFMLARLHRAPPEGEEWLHELKLDGVRALAYRLEGGPVVLLSRNRLPMEGRFPEVARALEGLRLASFVLDGEIAALDERGRTRFQPLQARLHLQRPADVARAQEETPAYYFLFDCLAVKGLDLRRQPLIERKAVLGALLQRPPPGLRYADHVRGRGEEFFRLACQQAVEGIIAKRADSTYRAGRGDDWRKVKCLRRREFLIGGYTAPRGSRKHFGALLLGAYRDGRLVYVGKVGTGFDQRTLTSLHQALSEHIRQDCPFDPQPPERATWVDPQLVAEIEFGEWTDEGRLRAPVYLGLRAETVPGEVTLEALSLPQERLPEEPAPAPEPSGGGSAGTSSRAASARESRWEVEGRSVPVSNLDKVLWPEEGYTKRDLLEYYRDMAALVDPYLRDRPLSMNRCPDGPAGDCFYQKEAPDFIPDWIRTRRLPSDSDRREEINYIIGGGAATLVYLANLACIEQNPWASTIHHLEEPDLLLFDLDPSGVEPGDLRAVARLVGDVLRDLGLEPFIKTSGGKGFHVMVPLKPDLEYEHVRTFARAVVEMARRREPRLITVSPRKEQRKGKVFVDYLRNIAGATMTSPYSVRPRPGAGVSTPLDWEELSRGVEPAQYHLANIRRRLAQKEDPFARFWERRQDLREAVRAYGS